ncbi:hypothetical protein HRR83_004867 [Exophiala dermatitidis]|uniref:2-methylcitrate dehydratase n=2 Tax=Exophiala dermatitidis TaxID=5970 RepID=H6C3Q9_EXODN|nr:2-methylcitrate dehydratase [Exophiala dermatitidis NIH/UT8656]KAJ4513967.1 hypothetical protein HRR75_004548 [Exophiala dermatitidis]EHY58274.1 2-methylcitrate dehydratase [Exophiala dermatitidis NIH/UT8656]KAJ4517218.1 hypothetical protein HRR74_004968 [Exophiala dermatitidis]KAJ4519605.1 hypothetical protein HRR73_003665 [Exophiala dermatitidis]KAJ4534597.1 hypothetical protein HRR76_006518 [Exophiala dermatitidis]
MSVAKDSLSEPNGVNGTTKPDEIPVTGIFSNFVSNVQPESLTSQVRERLKEYILDYIGVTLAAAQSSDSTEPIIKAVKTLGGQTGTCTVVGKGKGWTAAYAGLLNATLGHSLDFDDTYAPGTLHAGVTAIGAGLSQAELLGESVSIDQFLLAVAVGYEITCRLGRELGNEAYARGFHNTSTAGIFGAVATISVLKRLSVEVVANAFGLAGSKAAGSMQYLENGSWNKRLHPGFAVHDAFQCVALAEAGVIGAAKILEGTRFGFLHAYSPKENKDINYLVSDLGKRWEFLETSLKPFPACRMTHGFIEYAAKLGRDKGYSRASDVKGITLSLSPNNLLVVGARTPNKVHPENMVDAQFSAYFTTANSFLYGSDNVVKCYEKERLHDPEVRALADKIVCVADTEIKQFGSKIKVEYKDGKVEEVNIPFPLGEAQHPFTRDQVEKKFYSLVDPVLGRQRGDKIRETVENIEKASVTELLGLLY